MKAIAIPRTVVQPQFNPIQKQKDTLVAQWFRVDSKLICKWFAV